MRRLRTWLATTDPGGRGGTVRAHYGALPLFAGWTWTGKGGEIPPEAVPEARSSGQKRRGGAPKGDARGVVALAQPSRPATNYPRAFRRVAPLMGRGEISQSSGASASRGCGGLAV
jgi:hypothetical protein